MLIAPNKKRLVMFVDISGSSNLYRAEGDSRAKQIIDDQFSQLDVLLKEFDGRLIKTIGDELMLTFKSVEKAAHFAIRAQQLNQSENTELSYRIGADFGDILQDKGDVFGEVVNNAAHLTSLASGGQIMVSETIAEILAERREFKLRAYDQVALKGQQEPILVYRLFWQPESDRHTETRFFTGSILKDMRFQTGLLLRFGDEEWHLNHHDPGFSIGRDAGKNRLCVNLSRVSRQHCMIEYRNGKFVVEDFSTNGCWIKDNNEMNNFIRREEFPLLENGKIALGTPFSEPDTPVIEFFLMD